MSEMVDQAAEAIWQVWQGGEDDRKKIARAVIASLRDLPQSMKDPYWSLSHVKGATHANPIPSLQAAIDAVIGEALR